MYGPDEIDKLLNESSEKEAERHASLRIKRLKEPEKRPKDTESVSEDEGCEFGIQEFYKRSIS